MTDLKLISAGDDIKIWDVGTMNIVKQFNPHSHGLSCVKWSNNNQTIASTSTSGDKIALTSVKRLPNVVTESIAEGEKQTCLSFISNCRYLISGGKDKIVKVWDMKSRTLKKTFKEHTDAVTCVTVNFNDTHIASGSYSGDIILSNVVSGQSFSPLRAPKVQAIRGLQYSHFKKSLLGSVSDDGALNLWDASTRKLLKSFTDTHRSPATALCFSPVNDMLLASVGLDKRIVCYDAQGKSAVKVITADSPLTSIDFMTDGATFVVGTSRGQIKVYDLRMGETPKNIFTAHKLSVQCLTFQRPFNKNDTVSSRSSRTTTQSRKFPSSSAVDSGNAESDSPESEQENINIDQRFDQRPTKPTTGLDDVFSPITNDRDVYRNHYVTDSIVPRPDTVGKAESSTSVFSPLSDNLANVVAPSNKHGGTTGSNYNSNLYTPLAQPPVDGGYTDHPTYMTPTPIITSALPYAPSPSRSTQPETASLSDPIKVSPVIPTIEESSSRRSPYKYTPPTTTISSSSRSPYTAPSTTIESSTRSPYRSTLPHRSSGNLSTGPAGDPPVSEVPAGAVGGSPSIAQFQPFQVEFIKNMIEDAVEEARVSLHRDVVNLQVEMLRQFQIQMNDMKAELAKYSVNDALVAEIERLKEENRRLKTKY